MPGFKETASLDYQILEDKHEHNMILPNINLDLKSKISDSTNVYGHKRWRYLSFTRILLGCCIMGYAGWTVTRDCLSHRRSPSTGLPRLSTFSHSNSQETCPQVRPLRPSDDVLLGAIYEDFENPIFMNETINLLARAVQIETESYDNLGSVGEDERWEKFAAFHSWLEGAFPNVHAKLEKETVNTWGLIYTWKGSDASLKPIMLAAHQDVVPVDKTTIGSWVHPPYSGHFDGKYIWGRGSGDDKTGLVGIMIAMETLVRHEFKPTRTIVLAFGFDEEISGRHGAAYIAEFLLERYGKNAMAMIVDEGGGYSKLMGQLFAVPGVGEKGAMNVKVTVNTPGGHSSVPPPHTGIGILSSLVMAIEAEPIPPKLTRLNPYYATLQCVASYAPDLPKNARNDIIKSRTSDKALKKVLEWALSLPTGVGSAVGGTLSLTSQAVTLIQGGVKANALPEQSYAVVNMQIVPDSSVGFVQSHLKKVLTSTVKKYNLSFTSWDDTVVAPGNKAGSVIVSDAFGYSLEPAPVTPIEGTAWEVLGGTIKAVGGNKKDEGEEIVVAPGIMSGNTDTKHYWDLSTNIFRYGHLNPEGMYNGFHTINEAITSENVMGQVQFIALLALNADEALF